MSKTFHTRVGALLVSAVMAASSLAVTSSSFAVTAAGTEVTVNKELATSIPDPEDKDHPTNESECTYMCKAETDTWTLFTDTPGVSPADLLGTESVKTLQFNFAAAEGQYVTDFSYYFGYSADKEHEYYWDIKDHLGLAEDDPAPQVHPYANEFSVVVDVESFANLGADGKFQLQNCYTGLISEADKTRTQDASITLKSITVNGTTDTSEGEPLDWMASDDDLPGGTANTGYWYYSSANQAHATSVDQGGDTVTITTRNSLQIDPNALKTAEGNDIVLTPGDNCSEEYYASDDYAEANGGALLSEADIRAAGEPLNSHKFSYADFNFNPGATVSEGAKVTSLSVTLQISDKDACVDRFMYGCGMHVENGSPADTESPKAAKGLKADGAGYWYNDIGGANLAQCQEAGVEFGIDIGGGSDIAKRELGSYFTVTWDVPEEVIPYEDIDPVKQISFQLWYAALAEGEFTDCTIVDAVLTYEEKVTVPCTDVVSKKIGESAATSNTVRVDYSDLGMNYEKTADIYAVQFDVTVDSETSKLQIGAGTSALEKLGVKDSWFQTDDNFDATAKGTGLYAGKPILLNWEESVPADSRRKASETTEDDPYADPAGTKTYSYMWVLPPEIATTKAAADGSISSILNYVNTEGDDAHLEFGVWYGDGVKNFTLDNVTVYYAADDTKNEAKADLFEDPFAIDGLDENGEVTVKIGETVTLTANNDLVTPTVDDKQIAIGKIDSSNTKLLNVVGVSVGTTIMHVSTKGGQKMDLTVNVVGEIETQPAETTEDVQTTTKATTTTAAPATTSKEATTTKKPTTTAEPVALKALYGDVNCDGKVDISDAVMLNKAAAKQVELNDQQFLNADVNVDESVGVDDAVILLKFLVTIIKELPQPVA